MPKSPFRIKFRILQFILFGFCLMCVGTIIGLSLNLKCSSVTENSDYTSLHRRMNETMAIDSTRSSINFIRDIDGKIDDTLVNLQNVSSSSSSSNNGMHRIIDGNGFSITTTTANATAVEAAAAVAAGKSKWDALKRNQSNDSFDDLQALVDASLNVTQNDKYVNIIVAPSPSSNDDDDNELHLNITEQHSNSLDRFHRQITRLSMYSEKNAKIIDAILKDMAQKRIVHVIQMDGGTQLKLIITYENGMKAIFKPMRFSREYQTPPNHFYFNDFERHTAEIAAFHLDRVLGFRRCVPVTGRRLNITTEIFAIADSELMRTAYVSPGRNLCFHGKCNV